MDITKRMLNVLIDEEKYDIDDDDDYEWTVTVLKDDDEEEEEEEVEDKDEDEEEEDEEKDAGTDPTDYEELKAYLETLSEEQRIERKNFETLRNTANGYRPDYKTEKTYKAIKELEKEEEQQ
eukprot:symbB.v1.2.037589.t1/scaffold5594.1/size25531/1